MKKITLKKIKTKVDEFNDLLARYGYCYDISRLQSKKYDKKFNLLEAEKFWKKFLKKTRGAVPGFIDLYIHTPFCRKKCTYCSYISWEVKDKKIIDDYIDYVISQARFFSPIFAQTRLGCVYMGGGTANVFTNEQIDRLLSRVFENFKFSGETCERTFELNPSWVTAGQLTMIKKYGFNRLSIGVQSFSRRTLAANNRGYQNYSQVKKAIGLAKQAGFKEINADLMVGFPTDSAEDFLANFEKLAKLGPSSIIVYGLHPPNNSYLSKWGLNSKDFFEKNYPRLIDKVLAKMPALCQKVGYVCEAPDPAKFHWGYRRQDSAGADYLANEYRGEFMKNVLGLGLCARSHIKGVAEFKQVEFQEKINLREKIYSGRVLDPKDEMLKFVIDSIDQRSEVSPVIFKLLFSRRLEEVFPRALYSLKQLRVIKKDKDVLRFLFKQPKDKYIYSLFFVYEPFDW